MLFGSLPCCVVLCCALQWKKCAGTPTLVNADFSTAGCTSEGASQPDYQSSPCSATWVSFRLADQSDIKVKKLIMQRLAACFSTHVQG
jgi:hypothetical protein